MVNTKRKIVNLLTNKESTRALTAAEIADIELSLQQEEDTIQKNEAKLRAEEKLEKLGITSAELKALFS